ncbi:hypothetical protein SNE25_19795 [Mucilaginibacter sabulilitoris]|uniref:Uncharacterized protein n=1 Tax=Mucilaginibacter sabulilitoris TaxID=1173583 RepID=A0ABZ0TED7_9SPHI|nr:hypothetical protein [Mucilaginibacter sabulilitoris]WPU91562.1 hypothetical protein SNE25_19795 [Mucilaginibacter sabulilitoris]
MVRRLNSFTLACILCLFLSCSKDKKTPLPDPAVTPPPETPPGQGPGDQNKGIYSDSLFFVQQTDITIKPVNAKAGTYSSIPDGLKLEEATGEIDINKSETGLKYKVTFTPSGGGETQTSYVIISGINYQDKIYNLSKGDSVAVPIYNANSKLALPGANKSSVFDKDGDCKKAGIVVNNNDGRINLAQSVRNQSIDTGATEEVKLRYSINDNSNKAPNGLNVKIYFYRTAKEIPQYLTDLLEERKTSILTEASAPSAIQSSSLITASLSTNAKKATRARPPCIIVVSR